MYNFAHAITGSSITLHLTLIMDGNSDVEITSLTVKEKISNTQALCIDEAGLVNAVEITEVTEDQFKYGTTNIVAMDFSAIQYTDGTHQTYSIGKTYFTELNDDIGKFEAFYTDLVTNKKYMVVAQRLQN